MSMQIKLIPIYIEGESLVSMDEESYKNNLEAVDLAEEIGSRTILSESPEEANDVFFGSKKVVVTPMKDKELLIKSLSKFTKRFKDREELEDFLDTGSLTVEKNTKGTYNLCFNGYFRDYEIEEISNEILKEYALDIQEMTYEKVLKKIKENNLSIESEEISNDDSIVLTLTI